MKRTVGTILVLLLAAVLCAPMQANKKTPAKAPMLRIYLDCNALTTGYTYSELRGEIAGELTKDNCMLVRSADDADYTIQVGGVVKSQQKTDFGATTLYMVDISASIMIDRGAYAARIFETTLSKRGKDTRGFDEASVEAYKQLTPLICETIKEHIR